ncbi:MAG: NHLP bacteriocin system secretion protein [Oscillatoria sp. PMC 1051.18]|nr:NHLP bacteriocin system secretion protein [Oscillatoria sp. PMC 1050.18]MEC5028831.1 NHLP bacteriocin system secretion protein [Oscillatoria sp. PMC 1051.18]
MNNLFRKEALNRVSSPERIDELMQVVTAKNWLALLTTGSLVAFAGVWSIWGRIPITVKAEGVLIQPRRVVELQSAIAGQLKELKIAPGDCIETNQILATIEPTEVQQQLAQQRNKLTELKSQDRQLTALQQQQTNQQQQYLQQQRQALLQELRNAENLAPNLQKKQLETIQKQRQLIQQKLDNARELAPTLKQRLENRRQLREEGAISADALLEAEQTYLNSLTEITDLQAQLQELEIRELQAEESYQESLNKVAQLQAQLEELASQQQEREQVKIEAANTRQNEIQAVEQNVAQLELKLAENSQIFSQHRGCILEVTTTAGEYINPGNSLATLQISQTGKEMLAVSYFSIQEGKKIEPGMEVQVTPNTVKREEFGGIVGTVTEVSPFPVTKQGATELVGNAEVVEKLLPEGGAIAVFTELQPNTSNYSGYQWSASAGPELKITSGTTTSSRVTVNKQAPIELVIPLLKQASGI